MPRSRSRRAPRRAARPRLRLQTVGLFATLLAVAALVGSLAWGLLGPGTGEGEEAAAAPARTRPSGRVRVEVLNASGTPGLARRATDVLRDRGFDVVELGNARGFAPDSSLVLDRVGRIELARQVADALGVRRVRTLPDADLYLDVTVVLGRDWAAP
ncbi:MAG TPA: LytR C-terminal domain-containing protein [Longimicrobiaceae bacterium]|nr:LytR C-terminal domain-containing protein [Longimicrobiaceae bacterium]